MNSTPNDQERQRTTLQALLGTRAEVISADKGHFIIEGAVALDDLVRLGAAAAHAKQGQTSRDYERDRLERESEDDTWIRPMGWVLFFIGLCGLGLYVWNRWGQ